ncbi:MAG: ATP-binding protein [Bacteroidia bacterium]|nr:ATP-binding protein [Bacteroidia bacterium]MDW8134197.1 ATP-binding protein [Bacteroidia bacterium]
MKRPPVMLFWSSGKDSAWALYQLKKQGYSVQVLLTTFSEAKRQVPYHEVGIEWVRLQAAAAGILLWEVPIPFPCDNTTYETILTEIFIRAFRQGIRYVAFGDLYLRDVREYRARLVEQGGLKALFPIWLENPQDSWKMAHTLIKGGIQAVITWADPVYFPDFKPATLYDEDWLTSLPAGVDPCGERGEFHTFCFGGPLFKTPLRVPFGSKDA